MQRCPSANPPRVSLEHPKEAPDPSIKVVGVEGEERELPQHLRQALDRGLPGAHRNDRFAQRDASLDLVTASRRGHEGGRYHYQHSGRACDRGVDLVRAFRRAHSADRLQPGLTDGWEISSPRRERARAVRRFKSLHLFGAHGVLPAPVVMPPFAKVYEHVRATLSQCLCKMADEVKITSRVANKDIGHCGPRRYALRVASNRSPAARVGSLEST